MPTLKLDPDPETYKRLVERAAIWRRPIVWQAEVELRQAVGLPFPPPTAQYAGGEDDPAIPGER
jgi:hypothetical protein